MKKMRKKIAIAILAGSIFSSPALAETRPYFSFSTYTNPAVIGGSKLFSATFEVAPDTGTLSIGSTLSYGGAPVTVNSFSGLSVGDTITNLSINFNVAGTTYAMTNSGIDILPGSDNTVVTWSNTGRNQVGGTSVATMSYYGMAAPEIDGGLAASGVLLFGVFALWAARPRDGSLMRIRRSRVQMPA